MILVAIASTSLACDDLFLDNSPAYAPPGASSEWDMFATYGSWSHDATYGTVWTPADPTFVPWAAGNVEWAPVTFQHGRWVSSEGRWRWVPESEFANRWLAYHDRWR